MKKRTLLISFVVIAILSLLVSCAALFTTARAIARHSCERDTPSDVTASDTSYAEQTVAPPLDTEDADASDVGEDVFVGADAAKLPKYTLKYADNCLKILAEDGAVLYSRKAPSGKPAGSELDSLREGIGFSDYSAALSAIYDLIS